MKKKLSIFSLVALFALTLGWSQSTSEQYSQISVNISNPNIITDLVDLGMDIDHATHTAGPSIVFFVDQNELSILNSNNISYNVLIPDFRTFYAEMQQSDLVNIPNMVRSANVANGFDLGSMGGFYTFDEMVAKLDEMKQDYPDLITTKSSIGTSVEGRDIWMVKISDNPNVNEPEPVAYFDAVHHAREPLAQASTINFMFWLLENYDINAAVKYLVDNRELYFVPIVNPDGYKYNELTDPNGGGLWRKNRAVDPGGCVGVDLNRNYGYEWGHNNSCSSPNPCSNTYRGTVPFSEPESIAVRDFVALVEPNVAFSTHSTAGTYLMPFGYNTSPPAYEIYSEWASSFLDENNYTYGVTFQMLGYTSCGTTRDYLHSEGIYGWTPEIDGNGFWPPQSTIFDLVGENVRPFFYKAWLAGAHIDIQSHQVNDDVLPGDSFELVIEVKNTGLESTLHPVSVILEASDPGINVPTAMSYGTIAARSKVDNSANPFVISVDPTFSDSSFTITAAAYQEGALNEIMEIPVFLGHKTVIFMDDAEAGSGNWTPSGTGIAWSTCLDDSYSGSQSFGDSDGGNGENDTLNYFELNQVIDLNGTISPVLSFATKQSIADGDVAQLQISTDGGTNWSVLETYTLNESWNIETFDLSAYSAFSDVRFRFTLDNNGFEPGDGFYFDDFEIADYDTDVLGISDTNINSEIFIHPNPFEDHIIISSTAAQLSEIDTIALYTISGQQLEVTLAKESGSFIVSGIGSLSRGLYFLKALDTGGNSISVSKLLKM